MTEIFRFQPLLVPTIWGGHKLARLKGVETGDTIGESWEISGVEGHETVVADGPCRGLTLSQLVARLKGGLVGASVYRRFGDHFPLLIKFIDARRDLSIQVHPNDEIAHRHGQPMGKTEMWYVLPSEPGAQLYSGLKRAIDAGTLARMVADKTITEALARYEVSEGDVYFIPAGRIHAIGAGCMVAEIQQTSDTTYRLYDYDRRDAEGRLRPLHVEQAAECIDYRVQPDYRTSYQPAVNAATKVVECPYFTTQVMHVSGTAVFDCAPLDTFVIVMTVGGEGTIAADDNTTAVKAGHTLLLPAGTNRIEANGSMTLLLTYVA